MNFGWGASSGAGAGRKLLLKFFIVQELPQGSLGGRNQSPCSSSGWVCFGMRALRNINFSQHIHSRLCRSQNAKQTTGQGEIPHLPAGQPQLGSRLHSGLFCTQIPPGQGRGTTPNASLPAGPEENQPERSMQLPPREKGIDDVCRHSWSARCSRHSGVGSGSSGMRHKAVGSWSHAALPADKGRDCASGGTGRLGFVPWLGRNPSLFLLARRDTGAARSGASRSSRNPRIS